LLWIPEEALSACITAMNNMVRKGMDFEELPHVFIYPLTIDMDSSGQTADTRFKNLVAFNDYGMLTDKLIEETFEFTRKYPKWRNTFARLGNITNLNLGKDYPIFIPNDNISAITFAELARIDIFNKRCGVDSVDSMLVLPFAEYTKLNEAKKEAAQPDV
jgi:hypothetical protein